MKNSAIEGKDSDWKSIESEIILTDDFSMKALEGIDQFSHLEIIFLFDKAEIGNINTGSRHPRDNKELPKVGIFAQRGKDRPNRLGATIVELISCSGKTLTVRKLDALDGTPVIDIKPVMKQFLPEGVVKQPEWTEIVMKNYW